MVAGRYITVQQELPGRYKKLVDGNSQKGREGEGGIRGDLEVEWGGMGVGTFP